MANYRHGDGCTLKQKCILDWQIWSLDKFDSSFAFKHYQEMKHEHSKQLLVVLRQTNLTGEMKNNLNNVLLYMLKVTYC